MLFRSMLELDIFAWARHGSDWRRRPGMLGWFEATDTRDGEGVSVSAVKVDSGVYIVDAGGWSWP